MLYYVNYDIHLNEIRINIIENYTFISNEINLNNYKAIYNKEVYSFIYFIFLILQLKQI